MHPDDLAALGLTSGDMVCITSSRASILGVVAAEAGLRRGLVSMSHAFGDIPERDAEVREIGATTARLVSVEHDYDPYTGIPRMSAIPVGVERCDGADGG